MVDRRSTHLHFCVDAVGFDVDGFYQRDLLIGVSARCVGTQRLEAARLPLLSETSRRHWPCKGLIGGWSSLYLGRSPFEISLTVASPKIVGGVWYCCDRVGSRRPKGLFFLLILRLGHAI